MYARNWAWSSCCLSSVIKSRVNMQARSTQLRHFFCKKKGFPPKKDHQYSPNESLASFSLWPLRIPDATKACRASGLFQFMARSFSRFVPNWFCCRYCNQIKSCVEKKIFLVAMVRLSAFEATPLKLDINSSAICVLSIKVYILTSNLAAVFYFRRAR